MSGGSLYEGSYYLDMGSLVFSNSNSVSKWLSTYGSRKSSEWF